MGLLIKFTKKEKYGKDLMDGKVYFSDINCFPEIENDYQGDPIENKHAVYQIDNMELKTEKGQSFVIRKENLDNFQFNEHYNKNTHWIFSLACMSEEDFDENNKFSFCSKMDQFGSNAVVFRNSMEFIRRVEKAALEQNLKITHHKVNYSNLDKGNFQRDLFQKDSDYSYQKEYRMYIQKQCDQQILNIGPIEDIATLLTNIVPSAL